MQTAIAMLFVWKKLYFQVSQWHILRLHICQWHSLCLQVCQWHVHYLQIVDVYRFTDSLFYIYVCRYANDYLDCVENAVKAFCGTKAASWQRELDFRSLAPLLGRTGCQLDGNTVYYPQPDPPAPATSEETHSVLASANYCSTSPYCCINHCSCYREHVLTGENIFSLK